MLSAFAELAYIRRWQKPTMLEADECIISITEGRHPIVEELCLLDGSYFVPNNILLNNTQCSMLLITGPNMAGKSTIMRQVALIQIMAQIGSYVPATSATLSICDSIFARVGASDDLASGRSTFMVEMSETAYILEHATHKSLILLDEIGRGTSTYDGMSIAHAVAEYIHNNIGSRTLFATHYHELVDLEKSLNKLKNYHVEVQESNNSIQFLYTLKEGPAHKSFGLQVAKLAGLPASVIERASIVLAGLEAKPETLKSNGIQPDLFALNTASHPMKPISEQITGLDINRMTPLQAMNKLQSLQNSLRALLR
jgi:DNA mismatch repair protein MutS